MPRLVLEQAGRHSDLFSVDPLRDRKGRIILGNYLEAREGAGFVEVVIKLIRMTELRLLMSLS